MKLALKTALWWPSVLLNKWFRYWKIWKVLIWRIWIIYYIQMITFTKNGVFFDSCDLLKSMMHDNWWYCFSFDFWFDCVYDPWPQLEKSHLRHICPMFLRMFQRSLWNERTFPPFERQSNVEVYSHFGWVFTFKVRSLQMVGKNIKNFRGSI